MFAWRSFCFRPKYGCEISSRNESLGFPQISAKTGRSLRVARVLSCFSPEVFLIREDRFGNSCTQEFSRTRIALTCSHSYLRYESLFSRKLTRCLPCQHSTITSELGLKNVDSTKHSWNIHDECDSLRVS